MELRRYLQLIRRRIVVVVLAVAVGLSVGYVVSPRTPTYESGTVIYIGARQFAAVANSTGASATMDRLTQTFAALIKTIAVANTAIQLTHVARTPARVAAATATAVVPDTNYIAVTVTDTDPHVAQSLANGVAQSFVALVQTLEPGAGAAPGSGALTSVLGPAYLPTVPRPTSTKRNLLLGGLFALAGGVALVAILNYLDLSVRNPEDVERLTRVRVLATVPLLAGAVANTAHGPLASRAGAPGAADPAPGTALPGPAE